MYVVCDSSAVLSDMGESSNLFTLAPFICKDGWQKEGDKETEISLCPVHLYSSRLRFSYKSLYPGSLQLVSSLFSDMMKKGVLLLG